MKVVTGLLAALLWVVAWSFPAAAQEVSFRTGVVTGISPIEVEAQPQPARGSSRVDGALGRAFGRVAGRAVAKASGSYSYEAYDVANSAARDVAAGAASERRAGRTETVYMVIIRFDDGRESAIQSGDAANLSVGSRVRVFGSGSSARVVAE